MSILPHLFGHNQSVGAAGFQIEKMLEPIPSDDEIARDNSLRKHLHRPLFMLIKARRT